MDVKIKSFNRVRPYKEATQSTEVVYTTALHFTASFGHSHEYQTLPTVTGNNPKSTSYHNQNNR